MGLDLEAGNPHTLRRLTVRELARMPTPFIARANMCEMFGVDPVTAGAMIINTGCLIIDLRRFDWAGMRWPGFQIKDELVWSPDGSGQAFTSPEDWQFSRWMHERNIPFFATRELILDHYGGHTYRNQGLYGEETDSTPRQPSIEMWEATNTQRKPS